MIDKKQERMRTSDDRFARRGVGECVIFGVQQGFSFLDGEIQDKPVIVVSATNDLFFLDAV
jgi:hypothetical protein